MNRIAQGIDRRSGAARRRRRHGPGLQPPGGPGHHRPAQAGRDRLLHVPQLRARPPGLRHAHRQLRAAAGRLRRPELLHAGPAAVYEIHVDNDGDAREDLTFQFGFHVAYKNIAVPAGGVQVPIPLINVGPHRAERRRHGQPERDRVLLGQPDPGRTAATGTGRRSPTRSPAARSSASRWTASATSRSPTTPPTPATTSTTSTSRDARMNGRVFVGQRREGFVVNLAEAFDLVNLNPLGAGGRRRERARRQEHHVAGARSADQLPDRRQRSRDRRAGRPPAARRRSFKWSPDKELSFLRAGHGKLTQVSRLGMPLVNELVIGIDGQGRLQRQRAEGRRPVRAPTSPTRRCPC